MTRPESDASVDISVVIPTTGRVATLREVLAALARQRFDPAHMEVVIVADGADAATLAIVEAELGRLSCRTAALLQPRGGAAAARNAGIAHAAGRVILMLDDDIVAEPQLVAEHARHHAGRGDTVVSGALPIQVVGEEPAHQRALRTWWERTLAEKASAGHRSSFRDFVTGNVSVPRERLLEVGGFDIRFAGCGREDYELGYRLQRAGLRFVHEPRAIGLHLYRKSPVEWLRMWRTYGRADVIFARTHPEIAGEVMTLVRFPAVPWVPAAVALGERAVLALNGRGGHAWKWAVGATRAAYYWHGVREEARDADELRWLVRARAAALSSTPA
ncbi:MAG: glycosyltransferase [Gemmatimonadaceae bacterium]